MLDPKKRNERVELKGIFQGAKVERGADWRAGEEIVAVSQINHKQIIVLLTFLLGWRRFRGRNKKFNSRNGSSQMAKRRNSSLPSRSQWQS